MGYYSSRWGGGWKHLFAVEDFSCSEVVHKIRYITLQMALRILAIFKVLAK